jgi:CDP-paratose 2-epimerase
MKIIVTGAAGFVGTNLSLALAKNQDELLLIDDLSRPLVDINRDYIELNTENRIRLIDITDSVALTESFDDFGCPDMVINLAGQVSLLGSIENPIRDFMINAYAPLSMLEYFRMREMNPIFLNISSNKVYGNLKDYPIIESEKRYSILGDRVSLDESTPLDFYGPYGCSKGTADQYLIDYWRIFGMKTISFRQSTIYGPFQRPTSDQGWVVYMIEKILKGESIRLNGIGKQVRDILYVSDLVELILKIPKIADFPFGQSFNVGGGPKNTLSILELFSLLKSQTGKDAKYTEGDERPGDQKYYVSNIEKISSAASWSPSTDLHNGILKVLTEKTKSDDA